MANSTEQSNALEVSDEDFLKNPALFATESAVPVDDEDHGEQQDDEGAEDKEGTAATQNEDPLDKQGSSAEPEENLQEQEPPADKVPDDVEEKEGNDPTPPPAGELTEAQYAEVGRQVMAEFKANGATMKVKSAADALQLMQMGANYHKKMMGLKPSLKTLKLLENNGLLDAEKINYLIDLSQKKPEAIKQLLKDSNLDPLSLDLEDEVKYVPSNRSVSDKEMILDEVLNSISDSPTYERTLNVISDQWDDASRKLIADDPHMIAIINSHVQNGVFDQVASAVAYERSLGKFVGVSEFEAYQRVGAYMHENNLFKSAAVSSPERKVNPAPVSPDAVARQQQEEAERRKRKQAASPSRQGTAKSNSKDTNYDPLAMSDEEFAKLNKLNL